MEYLTISEGFEDSPFAINCWRKAKLKIWPLRWHCISICSSKTV